MSPTTPVPQFTIPRIVPPQGERLPVHDRLVTPLPLEPDLVPNPPIAHDAVPKRVGRPVNAEGASQAMPMPAAAQKAAPVIAPAPPVQVGIPTPVKPWFLVEGTAFPADATVENQLLYVLAWFPLEDVKAQWRESVGAEFFDKMLAEYDRQVQTYVQEHQAWAEAQSRPAMPKATLPEPKELPEPTAAELAAVHADPPLPTPASNPPRVIFPEERDSLAARTAPAGTVSSTTLPHGSVVHHVVPAQQPAAVETAEETAKAEAAKAEKRRLGAKAKQQALELYAAGKSPTEIGQVTGLPLELVERALAGAPSPAVQAQAAEQAYQAELSAAPEEEAESAETMASARARAAEAVQKVIQDAGLPSAYDLFQAWSRISGCCSYYGQTRDYENPPRPGSPEEKAQFTRRVEQLRDEANIVLDALRRG
jgi:hypothetical protein